MKNFILLFVTVWFGLAVFDLNFDRTIFKAYTATEVVDYDPDERKPKLIPMALVEYRILEKTVVSRVEGYIQEYEDCTIFDRDNWTCTHSDDSGTFGAKQGKFFSKTNLEKFPHLSYIQDEKALSRFGYILLNCRWDLTGGIETAFCLLRPFTT